MKRLLMLVFAMVVLLSGCATAQKVDDVQSAAPVDVEIKDKLFIAQINDMYYNAKDYLGKTIKYEGIFTATALPNETYYTVIRYGPGCCGDDGNVGFEVQWDKEYPKPNDWVEATGVLSEYEQDGNKYLYLKLDGLNVLDVRGAETVTQ